MFHFSGSRSCTQSGRKQEPIFAAYGFGSPHCLQYWSAAETAPQLPIPGGGLIGDGHASFYQASGAPPYQSSCADTVEVTWQTQPYLRTAQGDPAHIPIEEAQQPQSLPARPSGRCQHVCGLQGASYVGLTGVAKAFLLKRPLEVDHESIADAID